MFISVFAPCYLPSHPRFSPNHVYVFFQPAKTFAWHGICGDHNTEVVSNLIRERFAERGGRYSAERVKQCVEAFLYILPTEASDPSIQWW